ncbi:MAG: sensor histidine kinase [Deltaproteobacteria bacterium]|jgi:two-component system, OmpR family, sensor kinase|nr:sensor histidine kinase [Deltaproteobacteria bacterium]
MREEKIRIELLIHDLKVPLAVIETGIMSLLKRQEKYGTIKEEQEKVLYRVLRNTKLIHAMVNDALELGRSREGIIDMEQFEVSNLVISALTELFDLIDLDISDRVKECRELSTLKRILGEKNIRLLINEALWTNELFLDLGKMKQILRNLLNNAFKYCKSLIELEFYKEKNHLVFSVRDDGEGIPLDFHKKIFKSYFQMDIKDCHTVRGHGLGLAGSMVLIEDMGGKLSLESSEGNGAKFIVSVPLRPKK